jgi:hypothetical protein
MKNIERMISTVVGKTKLLPFHVLGEDIAAIQNGYQQSCIHVFFTRRRSHINIMRASQPFFITIKICKNNKKNLSRNTQSNVLVAALAFYTVSSDGHG